ncbi:MAG: hypothetical protein V9F00_04770 [Nocardioides sp.]
MFDMTPIPGDPDSVLAESHEMQRTAQAIDRAARALERLRDYTHYSGESVDALRENAACIAEVLDKAGVRYRESSAALDTYAEELRVVQRDAEAAIAANASVDVAGATLRATEAQAGALNPLLTPEERAEAVRNVHQTRAEVAQQLEVVAGARGAYERARARWDEAAAATAGAIHTANDKSIRDSAADKVRQFLDQVHDVYVEVLQATRTVMDAVSTGALLVAGVLALTPLAPLAIPVLAVSKVADVISFAATLELFKMGEASNGELVVAIVGLVGGALLAKGTRLGIAQSRQAMKGMHASDLHLGPQLSPKNARHSRLTREELQFEVLDDLQGGLVGLSVGFFDSPKSWWNARPFAPSQDEDTDRPEIDIGAIIERNFETDGQDAPLQVTPCFPSAAS